MSHRFPLKEISRQSGLSLATVDRVIHGRSGVRETTRRRVAQAIKELKYQESQIGIQGQVLILDLVIEAPKRFTRVVTRDLERVLPILHPVVVRVRYHLAEKWSEDRLCQTITKIAQRGSKGVILKAPKSDRVRACLELLATKNIPVITLVSDQPKDLRLGYVGLRNHEAGATAAYLTEQWMKQDTIQVLISMSSRQFDGEVARVQGFIDVLKRLRPDVSCYQVDQGYGLYRDTVERTRNRLESLPHINAVYSVGGANRAILDAFSALNYTQRLFIGHDLDEDNVALLREGRLSAVLHHDLQQDLRRGCELILEHYRLLNRIPEAEQGIQIITPYNLIT